MADGSSDRRRPRIRKTAPTVREQIEDAAKKKQAEPEQRNQATRKPSSSLGKALKTLLRPLSPLGRALAKILGWMMPRYFINAWRELRQVTWPNRRETWRLTGAVFVFAVVFGALVAIVDKGLDEFFKKVILKQ